ncbi:MAG: hypothetical protein PHV36_09930 [Elusimicrobiales bacterium]|nr:hypothetical protein [Elusimicrobiales bacterium]
MNAMSMDTGKIAGKKKGGAAAPGFLHSGRLGFVKNAVEIELTTRCNLGCYNCDRSTRQAPSGESMSLGQLRFFMLESLRLGRKWDYISILGGEPTLHPRLLTILEDFRRLGFNTANIQIISNGYGREVRSALKRLPPWLVINDTRKRSPVQQFRLFNLAPADFGVKSASPCLIPQNCGHGLSRYGYYPCGAGASIDRVFGFDIGIKRLRDLTPENTRKQLKLLCRYCGHSPSINKYLDSLKPWEERGVFKETARLSASRRAQYTAPVSKSWLKAYEKYRKKKPALRLYGK